MGNKKVYLLLAVFLVPLLFGLGVEMLWNTESGVKVYTDTLIATGTIATSKQDSMSCFAWSPRYTVTIGPGYADARFFLRTLAQTLYTDSICQRFYLRGFTTSSRNQCMFIEPLWSYAAPYRSCKKASAYTWKDESDAAADSSTLQLVSESKSVRLDGRITKADSTASHIGKVLAIPWAPYYDIVMIDSAAVTGKNCYVKVTVVGYPNVGE